MMRAMPKTVAWLVLAALACGGCKKKENAVPNAGAPTDGGASSADVMTVIRAVRPQMEKCYDDAVAKKPDLPGKITLVFAINPDGRVDPTRAGLGGGTGEPAFAQCVLDIVVKQQFPAPKIATDVQLPLDLSKRKGDAGVADAAADAADAK